MMPIADPHAAVRSANKAVSSKASAILETLSVITEFNLFPYTVAADVYFVVAKQVK